MSAHFNSDNESNINNSQNKVNMTDLISRLNEEKKI